jgi:hypothetical protein
MSNIYNINSKQKSKSNYIIEDFHLKTLTNGLVNMIYYYNYKVKPTMKNIGNTMEKMQFI